MKEEIIQKVVSLGIEKKRAIELYNEMSRRLLEEMLDAYVKVSTEEEVQVMAQKVEGAINAEDFTSVISELASVVYKNDIEVEIRNFYMGKIQEINQQILDAKDLLNRAQNGDQEAMQIIGEAYIGNDYTKELESLLHKQVKQSILIDDSIVQKVKQLGVTESEAEEILHTMFKDLVAEFFEIYAKKATNEDVERTEERIEAIKSNAEFLEVLRHIASAIYGTNAQVEIQKGYERRLEEVKARMGLGFN